MIALEKSSILGITKAHVWTAPVCQEILTLEPKAGVALMCTACLRYLYIDK